MKSLVGLNDVMKDFDGRVIIVGNNQAMSMRDILTTHIGMWGSKDSAKTIKAYALGIKINNSKEDGILLEDEEYQILIDAVVKDAKMNVFAMGPILKIIDSAVVMDINKK